MWGSELVFVGGRDIVSVARVCKVFIPFAFTLYCKFCRCNFRHFV
jgi:hypothetical protein